MQDLSSGLRTLGASSLLLFCGIVSATAFDYNAPAEFEVTPIVANPDPGPFTATIDSGYWNQFGYNGFEPIVFGHKYHPIADAPNSLVLGANTVTDFNTYREGFRDGASVRVYRIIDGEMALVRTDTVAKFRASGWEQSPPQLNDSQIVDASVSEYQFKYADWNRKGVPYYFAVRAVDTAGNFSDYSNSVSNIPPSDYSGDPVNTKASMPDGTGADEPAGPPPTPQNLQVYLHPTTGVVVLDWEPVDAADLAGYEVVASDHPPQEHLGYGIDLAGTASTPEEEIRAGDMVFVSQKEYAWDKAKIFANRTYRTISANPPNGWTGGITLVPHPGTVPADFDNPGETCARLTIADGEKKYLTFYNMGALDQDFYDILEAGVDYTIEIWARAETGTTMEMAFRIGTPYGINSDPVTVDDQWRKYSFTFTAPSTWEASDGRVGSMRVEMVGPGTIYFDNHRIYDARGAFMDAKPDLKPHLEATGMDVLRTHGILSRDGLTMEGMTNNRGTNNASGRSNNYPTLPDLLRLMDTYGADPWLQIEMSFSEADLHGFVEYMAAPYDPSTDSAATKPWAHKRYMQGRQDPWIDAFDRVLYEISNETWNPIFDPWVFQSQSMTDASTGQTYLPGEIYGLFQEYTIAHLRSSPYWTQEVEDKFEFVLGGWGNQQNRTDGYGNLSASLSPNSDYLTYADYNGGWDNGEAPPEVNDEGYSKALTFVARRGRTSGATRVLNELKADGTIHGSLKVGTYEAGPGYNLNGLNGVTMTPEMVESESRVMKSQAAGVATLDSFLARGYNDYDIQNFFTFNDNRDYWTSHSEWHSGAAAYPSWKALEMWNHYGTGDFLITRTLSVPTWDLPWGNPGSPMADVYANRDGNTYKVWFVSRKLDNYPFAGDDGYTPMTALLPFENPTSITLYKMTGPPRAHNLDSEEVFVEQVSIPVGEFSSDFTLTSARGADERGMPPGSVFLYVFEGTTTTASLPDQPQPTVRPEVGGSSLTASTGAEVATFEVLFTEPVDGFTLEDLDLSASTLTTEALELTLVEAHPYNGTSYRVTATAFIDTGELTISIPAGSVTARADGDTSLASANTDNTVTVLGSDLDPSGGSVTIPAAGDTWVNFEDWRNPENSSTNYGDSAELQTGTDETGRSAFLKFNLVGVRERPVLGATLRLYVYDILNGGTDTGNIHAVRDDSWQEMTVTANTEPAREEILGTLTPGGTSGYMEVDITEFVEEQRIADSIISLKLADAGWWKIRSRESGDPAQHPELVVTYGEAGTAPTVLDNQLPAATVGEAYSERIPITGGNPPVTVTLEQGRLPAGLTLAADGTISGTPRRPQTQSFLVSLSDRNGQGSTSTITLRVDDAPADTSYDDSGNISLEGLVLHLKLNETEGNVADDASLNDNDGYLSDSGAFFAPDAGLFNGALEVDGASGHVRLPDSPQINETIVTERTISLWFQANNVARAARQVLIELGGATRGLNAYLENGTLYVGGWNTSESGWAGTYKTTTSVGDGLWHNLQITLDGSTDVAAGAFRAYLDGVEFDAANSDGSQLWEHEDDGAVGSAVGGTRFADGSTSAGFAFDGLLDEVRIYNRVLTVDERETLNESGGPVVTLTGAVDRDYWTGIAGEFVADLTGDASYPDAPAGTDSLFELQAANWNNPDDKLNWADNYGQRIRGFIVPEVSGTYYFWVTGNNESILSLSSDDDVEDARVVASMSGWTNFGEWDKYPGQKSAPLELEADQAYYVEVLHKEAGGGDHLSVGWTLPGDASSDPSGIVPGPMLSSFAGGSPTEGIIALSPPRTGSLFRTFWDGISGAAVADLTGSPDYPDFPDAVDQLFTFELTAPGDPTNNDTWGDNHGSRAYGYIVPRITGEYVFWVAGNNDMQLRLSTDASPDNAVTIASFSGWTYPYEWNKFASQKSAAVTLKADEAYYVELLHKESTNTDYGAVAWSRPGESQSAPTQIVPGKVLSAYPNPVPDRPVSAPEALDFAALEIRSYEEAVNQDVEGTVTVEDAGATLHLQGNLWKRLPLPYLVTPQTVLSFEFKSDIEGEIHALGLEDNNRHNGDEPMRLFVIHGTQSLNLGNMIDLRPLADYGPDAGSWVAYEIPIGSYYTGPMAYLSLINDHDISNPDGESRFRNVRLFEQ